jgi:hypothetical protein
VTGAAAPAGAALGASVGAPGVAAAEAPVAAALGALAGLPSFLGSAFFGLVSSAITVGEVA